MAEEGSHTRSASPASSLYRCASLETAPPPSLIIDDGTDESDYASTSVQSSTRSLDSSEYEFVEENGRTYHRYKDGKYILPNDAEERYRMNFQHELYLHVAGQRLYLAPLPQRVDRVLDLATGTGIWATQFADLHPESTVVGTDLSPIQPDWIPANCFFEIDDAEDEWTFGEPFDYIHARSIFCCFADPARLIREAYRHLSPGGWLEIQDPDFPLRFVDPRVEPGGEDPGDSATAAESTPAASLPPLPAMRRWMALLMEAAARAGRPWTNGQHYRRWMEEAGFEDVRQVTFYWPTSPWAKTIHHKITAQFLMENARYGVEAVSLRTLSSLGLSYEEIAELCGAVKEEFGDTKVKGYVPVLVNSQT